MRLPLSTGELSHDRKYQDSAKENSQITFKPYEMKQFTAFTISKNMPTHSHIPL